MYHKLKEATFPSLLSKRILQAIPSKVKTLAVTAKNKMGLDPKLLAAPLKIALFNS